MKTTKLFGLGLLFMTSTLLTACSNSSNDPSMNNILLVFFGFLSVVIIYSLYRFIGIFFRNLRQKMLLNNEPDNMNIEILKETFTQNDESNTKGIRFIIAQKENKKTINKTALEETIDSSLHFLLMGNEFKQKYYFSIKNNLPIAVYRVFYKRIPDKIIDNWFNIYDKQSIYFSHDFEKGPTLQCKWVDTILYVIFDKSIKSVSCDGMSIDNEQIPKIKLS